MQSTTTIVIIIFTLSTLISSCIDKVQERDQETVFNTASGRSAWRLKMRGSVEPEERLQAYKEMTKMYAHARGKRDGGLRDWVDIGPQSTGGRVRAFAVHPTNNQILYTGGVNGGVFKSTNGGASWTSLGNFFPSLAVTSILVNPNDPDIIYVATGEGITAGGFYLGSSAGAGIFKSEDGGDSWSLLESLDPNNLSGFYWINDLAFDPTDPSIFYAAAQGTNQQNPDFGSAHLYKFSSHGASYVDLPFGTSPDTETAYSIFINPSDPDHLMVGHREGLLISWNGGQDWTPHYDLAGFPSFPRRVEVGMSASNDTVVYALCQGSVTGTIARSTDQGMSWTTQIGGLDMFNNDFENAGDYHNVIWVDPDDSDRLIVGGIDLWRSITKGTSIARISDFTRHDEGLSAHADHHVIVAASDYEGSTNPKLYFGNDGGIAATDDWNTVTDIVGWDILNNGLSITQFYASDIDGANPHEIIAGSQDNGTWFSDDQGDSWSKVGGGDGGYAGLAKSGSGPNYATSQRGKISINIPPITFYLDYLDLDTIDDPAFIAPLQIYPTDANKILVGAENLWRVTYAAVAPNARATQVSPAPATNGETITTIEQSEDTMHVAVGYTNGSVYMSNNGSTGPWSPIFGPGAGMAYEGIITDIAIHPSNANRVMLSVAGYVDDNIWYTNDGGNSWVERSNGIPALHVNTLAWHPYANTWIYAGTDMGVMASEDNGKNWNVTPGKGAQDGPAIIEITQLQFTQGNTFGQHFLVATTFGRGIWKSEETIKEHIYIDEDACPSCGLGLEVLPYETIEEAEATQAHGQTWHLDVGNYPVTDKVIIDKRLGEIQLENQGKVVVGN